MFIMVHDLESLKKSINITVTENFLNIKMQAYVTITSDLRNQEEFKIV